MKKITERQKDVIHFFLKRCGMEKDRAKIIRIVTVGNIPTSSIDALQDYEAKIIIDALSALALQPDKKQLLIKEISFMAPYIADHFGFTNGDPIKNCFAIISERVFNLDAAHYFKVHRVNNLLSQLYDHIIDIAETGVIETLKELNIATTN